MNTSEILKQAWKDGKYAHRNTKGWPGHNKSKTLSLKQRGKISDTLTGRKLSNSHKNNIGFANLREKSPHWRGNNSSYSSKHELLYLEFGKANKCWNKECEKNSTKFHWANLSGLYFRNFDDWAMLCVKCHSQFDHGLIDLNLKEETWQFGC